MKISENTLYLVAHTREGILCRYVGERKTTVIAPNDLFLSGVLHLLLLNSRLQPLIERLVFIHNDDQAKVNVHTDKDNYARRSLVRAEVTLTDMDDESLTGNFSVTVTDANEVVTNTCNHILSSLLLTSDLKGYIEKPALYFSNTRRRENHKKYQIDQRNFGSVPRRRAKEK